QAPASEPWHSRHGSRHRLQFRRGSANSAPWGITTAVTVNAAAHAAKIESTLQALGFTDVHLVPGEGNSPSLQPGANSMISVFTMCHCGHFYQGDACPFDASRSPYATALV